jgi:HAMP domain-containing protein
VYIIDVSYQNNTKLIATESGKLSKQSFNNLEQSDVNMMSATMQGLMNDKTYLKLFMAKDKTKLYEATSPLFKKLKEKNRITNWNFISPEPANTVFLRVHKPEEDGDVLTRAVFVQSVKTKDFASGIDLGKASFALRVVHPYYNNGKLVGYMEIGEAIDHFLTSMREQTGNEYGMLIDKKYLTEDNWKKMREGNGQRNDWGDYQNVVLVGSTSKDKNVSRYDGAIAKIPNNGAILGQVKTGESVFVRGAFPIFDAANQKVGAVLYMHDITPIYKNMEAMRLRVIAVIGALVLIVLAMLLYTIQTLVVRRLNNLINTATVVVGGDYERQIVPSKKDEIGTFEELFEQFRVLFVGLIRETEYQSQSDQRESKGA